MVDNPYKYPYVPIGGIVEWDGTGLTGAPDLSTPEKVAAVYGYGTWEAYGAGRVTIGAGSGYSIGSEGGEATHTLTVTEMPRHDHDQCGITSDGNAGKIVRTNVAGSLSGPIQPQPYGYRSNAGAEYLQTATRGGSAAHNNLQPYRTVYRYRRIA